MITLRYSARKLDIAPSSYLIASIDSCVDWNAEANGEEPGYDEFRGFLRRLVEALVGSDLLYASFTERRGVRALHLKEKVIVTYRYPIYLPEHFACAVLRKLSKSLVVRVGSGLAFQLKEPEQLDAILGAPARPNEWLFFVAAPQGDPNWLALRPWYLTEHGYQAPDPQVVSAARWTIYHEASINYCEIQTTCISESALRAATTDCASRAGVGIHFASAE